MQNKPLSFECLLLGSGDIEPYSLTFPPKQPHHTRIFWGELHNQWCSGFSIGSAVIDNYLWVQRTEWDVENSIWDNPKQGYLSSVLSLCPQAVMFCSFLPNAMIILFQTCPPMLTEPAAVWQKKTSPQYS